MVETTTRPIGITPLFIEEQKQRIQDMIKKREDYVHILEDTTQSEEVMDKRKIDSFNEITKANREIGNLRNVLETIDDNSNYGVCLDCHNDIPTERLKNQPTTTRCTTCAAIHERKR